MSSIFVSYRRDETSGHAGRLIDRLNEHFGRDRVFFDLQAIRPGMDWVEALESALAECRVLVAVIGRDWVGVQDKKGRRRLDNPDDKLRRELASALRRKVPVVPVLVQAASMPESTELPDDLELLWRHQAIELTDSRWDYDVGQLIEALEQAIGTEAGDAPVPPERSKPAPPSPPLQEVPRPTALAEILPGAWQGQVVNPILGISVGVAIDFQPTGLFRGNKMIPGLGITSLQGQWQVLPGVNQLALQGQETNGFQVAPYSALIQILELHPTRLAGVSSAGEQVVFQRVPSS